MFLPGFKKKLNYIPTYANVLWKNVRLSKAKDELNTTIKIIQKIRLVKANHKFESVNTFISMYCNKYLKVIGFILIIQMNLLLEE